MLVPGPRLSGLDGISENKLVLSDRNGALMEILDVVTNVVTGLPLAKGNTIERITAHADMVGPVLVSASVNSSTNMHLCSRYVDPRRESTNGGALNLGVTRVVLKFNKEVFKADGVTEPDRLDFMVSQTGDGIPPGIVSAEYASVGSSGEDRSTIEVTLSRPITPREWTTIRAVVYDSCGVVIENLGDLGPGITEPDRIDIGFLPGDVNQNGCVSPLDLLAFKLAINVGTLPANGCSDDLMDYVDCDRSGVVNPLDLICYKRLINGISPATRSWSGVCMSHPQP